MPGIDRFVAVSEQVADDARRTLGIVPAKLSVVVSGVDTESWKPDPAQRPWLRQSVGVGHDTPILAAAGRLERGKGFHKAVDALAALGDLVPPPHLVILGAGSAAVWLKERAAEAGVSDRVTFTGFAEPATLARHFQGADLFLMPSLAHEALPLTLLQAMATGLPAVASAAGGIPTAVRPGQNGMLIPLGDTAALAGAIRELLADPFRRARMGALAREQAVARFSAARMVGELEGVLHRAAGGAT
jgi:glycosyltransferase involved in cell wall biosynthesis